MTGSTGPRRWCARLLLAGIIGLPAALTQLNVLSANARVTASDAGVAQLTIRLGRALAPVPRSYLGISVEDNELPLFERQRSSFAALLDALRPPGERAPVVMRIGGESADSSFWKPDAQTAVAAEYQQGHPILLSPEWMTNLGELVRGAGLNVILDLNLAAHSPEMAADLAAAAEGALPPGSVGPFEVGNEPDLYSRAFVGLTRAQRGAPSSWAFSFTIADYISLFGAYVRAVRAAVPGARFAGPSVISRAPVWVEKLVASDQARNLALVTVHNYPPFEGCALPGAPKYPRAARYLTDSVSTGVARSERFIVHAVRGDKIPVRVTELGSAVCGGVKGATDTFATALWAPDLLFNMLVAGVDGVNIHLRGNGFLNTALNYTPSGIYAEPLFYGMALFARTLGPGARLERVLRNDRYARLKAWAVRLRDGSARVLYVNKSAHTISVELNTGTRAPATLERMSAPSIKANRTVTLAGQRLGLDGRWQGTLATRSVPAQGGSYQVLVPAYSAALLMVPRR